MNATNEIKVLVDDLAGHWAEPTLETLKAAGIRHVSVGMELATWQILKRLLQATLRWQPAPRVATFESLSTLLGNMLRRAAVLVARKFEPQSVTAEFKDRLHRLAGDRRSTAAEHRLYATLVRQPALPAAFKRPRQTDFVPELSAWACGA